MMRFMLLILRLLVTKKEAIFNDEVSTVFQVQMRSSQFS